MMSGLLLFLVFAAIGAVALAYLMQRRLQAAQARALAAEGQAASHARSLGLLAQELQAPGLVLLGQSGQAGGPGAAEVAAEAQRLLRLADEVKEMLAASAGPRSLREEAVPLAALLAEAIATTTAQLGPARRQWRLAPDFDGLTLHADRRALRGAVLQVLARSARETRDADWIDLRPVITPETVAIVVEDEGAGMGAEDLSASAAAEAVRTRGLGFGLAVARSLLEAHGGELRLEAHPGIGARAWLTLPRARLLSTPAAAPAE